MEKLCWKISTNGKNLEKLCACDDVRTNHKSCLKTPHSQTFFHYVKDEIKFYTDAI